MENMCQNTWMNHRNWTLSEKKVESGRFSAENALPFGWIPMFFIDEIKNLKYTVMEDIILWRCD